MGVCQQAVVDNLALHVLVQAAHLALQAPYKGVTLGLALGLCCGRGLLRRLLRVMCLGWCCPVTPKLLWAAQMPPAGGGAGQPVLASLASHPILPCSTAGFSSSGIWGLSLTACLVKVQECVAQKQASHKGQAL